MPTTWDKGYDWILKVKEAYDLNEEKFLDKSKKEDTKQEESLKNSNSKIEEQKANLNQKNCTIVKEGNTTQEQSNKLQEEIQNYQSQYQKYTNKINGEEVKKHENENKIYTSKEIVKSNDKIIESKLTIKEQIEKTVQFADQKLNKIDDGFMQSKNIDLVNKMKFTDKKINALEKELEEQYSSINKYLEGQVKSIDDIKQTKELYTNTITHSKIFIQKSKQKFEQINSICTEMKKSTVPIFDKVKFDTEVDKATKSLQELDKVKSDYTEFTRLLSGIMKDTKLKSFYEVSFHS